jgi:hypothetical protein
VDFYVLGSVPSQQRHPKADAAAGLAHVEVTAVKPVDAERGNESVPPVVIVDERLARHFWPNGDPIGRNVQTQQSGGTKQD